MVVPCVVGSSERTSLMLALCKIVRSTGKDVLRLSQQEIYDTVVVDRHRFSSVDSIAGTRLRHHVASILPQFSGTVMEECDIARILTDHSAISYPLLICDAVEGSTNTKRGLAAHVRRPILGGTSVMLLENNLMASVIASAFFDFASQRVFSSVRGEPGSFFSFVDAAIIAREDVIEKRSDSQPYAVVAGYSHNNVTSRALIEDALLGRGIRSTGGTRSSAQDLLDIVCNQVDAYVDLRTIFPGTTDSRDEVLHIWDVGGIVPVLDGLGFTITDHVNRSWQDYKLGETFPLVVARPSIASSIRDAMTELPFVADLHSDAQTIPLTRTGGVQ